MNTFKIGNKLLKDLEVRLHGGVTPVFSQDKNEFKVQALVSGYAQKGWVAGTPVFEPFKAVLKFDLISSRTRQGYVIHGWYYRGTTGVEVKDYLRNLTHTSTELGRLFGTSNALGDYIFNEIETTIKVYLNTYY